FRSSDPDNDPLTFSWRQLSGQSVPFTGAQSVVIQFIPPVAGAYAFGLTVNDGRGGVATAAVTLTAVTSTAAPKNGVWVQIADMPTPRRQFAAAAVRGKIYTFGGSRGASDRKSVV